MTGHAEVVPSFLNRRGFGSNPARTAATVELGHTGCCLLGMYLNRCFASFAALSVTLTASALANAEEPAPPVLLTPKGLEHVGPRAFGYDLDFRSVFA